MPASTTALTVLSPPGTPAGPTWDEQAADVSPGNAFLNDGVTMLYVRNTTLAALNLILEADLYGVEKEILTVSIPGSGTEHGVKILGPFPPGRFNNHETTDAAKGGYVMCRQDGGSDGDLVLCPFRVNKGLLIGQF